MSATNSEKRSFELSERRGRRRDMQRLIFHVDVNSAFLSWEAAKRIREGEDDLRLIPSCVGGNPERRTSIVLAKSIPAKKFGVKTGEPIAMALRKCPDLVIVGSDFGLYDRNSRAFMDICREYAPVLEKFSIDECFLDMTGTNLIYPNPIETAYEIKDKIRDTLGFTVNIGVGSNKLLAKMASDFEKPDRVHTLFTSEIPDKFWPLPVGELFSVGKNVRAKLEKAHIHTIGDLAKYDVRSLQALIGVKPGLHLHNYANGIDDSPVMSEPPEAKSYGTTTTLEEDVTTYEQAYRILLSLADSVAFRIRADRAKAFCITVTIRGNDFKNKSHQRKINEATDITTEIFEISKGLFQEVWDGNTPLRLLGISLSDITKEEGMQLSLFQDERKEKARKADQAMDAIRRRYGVDIVKRGAMYGQAERIGRKHKAKLENERKYSCGNSEKEI